MLDCVYFVKYLTRTEAERVKALDLSDLALWFALKKIDLCSFHSFEELPDSKKIEWKFCC